MGKLKPLEFNTPPVGAIEVALRRRKGIQTSTITPGNQVRDLLCPICSAPLDARDFLNGGAEPTAELSNGVEMPSANGRDDVLESSKFPDAFKSTCCPSCSFQIIPKKGPKAEAMYKILPEVMRERAVANFRDRQSWMRYFYTSTPKKLCANLLVKFKLSAHGSNTVLVKSDSAGEISCFYHFLTLVVYIWRFQD
jgi:hypothetical protein